MPFHVPPISRRAFLARTLTAAAGACALRQPFAAEPAIEVDSWALLSDSHLAESTATISRGHAMHANFLRVNQELLALPKRPRGALHLGDCAFKTGTPGDYEVVKSLIKPLSDGGLGVHLLLGNHDDREVFWKALENNGSGPRPIASKHVAVVEHARANWFLLDSLTETGSAPGGLGEEQLTWLTRELDARSGRPALVCVHHNTSVNAQTGTAGGFTDVEALLKALVPRPHVKALLFGHTHTWNLAKHRDLHLINLPAIGYPPKEGSTVPTGWVECLLRDNGIRLILHARETAHADHLRPIELTWRA